MLARSWSSVTQAGLSPVLVAVITAEADFCGWKSKGGPFSRFSVYRSCLMKETLSIEIWRVSILHVFVLVLVHVFTCIAL